MTEASESKSPNEVPSNAPNKECYCGDDEKKKLKPA